MIGSYYPKILVDSGVLIAFYDEEDKYHSQTVEFFSDCRNQLITTVACVTEVMWLLAPFIKVQNEFLSAVAQGVFECEHLIVSDYQIIQELNSIYQDLPGDFADLSLIAISERLNIPAIASLDKDFDVYRRYRQESFVRVFRPIR